MTKFPFVRSNWIHIYSRDVENETISIVGNFFNTYRSFSYDIMDAPVDNQCDFLLSSEN